MRALTLALVFLATACATAPTPTPEPPGLPDGIYRASDGAKISEAELFADWAAIPGDGPLVVFVAETHDNKIHHAIQTDVVRALMRKHPGRVGLGLEMFPVPTQPILDAYAAGEIDAATLVARSDWEEIWGFDFALYAPMLELVALQGAPIAALNAPRELTRKIAKKGVAGLSDEERAALPASFGAQNPEHRAMIDEILAAVHEMDEATFERFYAAQVVWDATMAQSLARFIEANPELRAAVVVAGGYHVYRGLGIPFRLEAELGSAPRQVILIPVDTGDVRFGPEDLSGPQGGDYYLLRGDPKAESHP